MSTWFDYLLDPVYVENGAGNGSFSVASLFDTTPDSYALVSPPAGWSVNSAGTVTVDDGTNYAGLIEVVASKSGYADKSVYAWVRVFTPNHVVDPVSGPNFSLNDITPSAGDVVVIRAGTITTVQDMNGWTGTSGSPIVVIGDGSVTIDGSGMPSGDAAIVGTSGFAHVHFCNFTISMGDNTAVQRGLYGYNSPGIGIEGITVHGCNKSAYFRERATGSDAAGGFVRFCTIFNNVDHNDPNTIFSGGGWARAIGVDGGAGIEIAYNRVYENHGEGIGIRGCDGANVHHNILWDNLSVNIYLDSSINCTVTGNIIFGNNSAYYSMPSNTISDAVLTADEQGVAAHLALDTTGHTVTGNFYVSDMDAPWHDTDPGWTRGTGPGTSVYTPNTPFSSASVDARWQS